MQQDAAARRRGPSPFSFVWGVVILAMVIYILLLGLPILVNGAAHLTGLEQPATFHPVSYSRDCTPDDGCTPKTDGYLSGTGDRCSWPGKIPLGRPVQVRAPVWAWGWGRTLLIGTGDAIVGVIVGLFLTLFGGAGCAILGVAFLGRQPAGELPPVS